MNDFLQGGQLNFFATQSAANNWANQNDSGNADVEPIYRFTVTASQTVNIGNVTVVFYNGSGTEIDSSTLNVGQSLTGGQSYTESYYDPQEGDLTPNEAPHGTASCQVVEVATN